MADQSNPLGDPLGGPPRRGGGPIPAPGKPAEGGNDAGSGPWQGAPPRDIEREHIDRLGREGEARRDPEPAPSTLPTTEAAILATLTATVDQHSAEVDALARAQRSTQRSVLILSGVALYLVWRLGKPDISEAVRNAVASPDTP